MLKLKTHLLHFAYLLFLFVLMFNVEAQGGLNMNNLTKNKCEVCGSQLLTYFVSKYDKYLCRRHKMQMDRHGKVYETTIGEKGDVQFVVVLKDVCIRGFVSMVNHCVVNIIVN